MSELVNAGKQAAKLRRQLLATVSALTLVGSCAIGSAAENDTDTPSIWIELGGQLNRLQEGQDSFSPPLMDGRPPIFSQSQKFERLPLYSIDETGKLIIQPHGSDWVLSASVAYGRSVSHPHVHQQTTPADFTKYIGTHHYDNPPSGARFADTTVHNSESHLIVDFQAGKDVGLGLFGKGSSVLSLGVRYAQFNSQSAVSLKSNPDWHFNVKYYGTRKFAIFNGGIFHSNVAELQATRSFHGLGPSLSWKASEPILGDAGSGEVEVDWGINAALLFGRQRASTTHHATGRYANNPIGSFGRTNITYQPSPVHSTRSRGVTIPNVGGFAGASYRIENFKVSAGYRADFFFGVMDGGIDTRETYDRNFHGPFATISIGLGG